MIKVKYFTAHNFDKLEEKTNKELESLQKNPTFKLIKMYSNAVVMNPESSIYLAYSFIIYEHEQFKPLG